MKFVYCELTGKKAELIRAHEIPRRAPLAQPTPPAVDVGCNQRYDDDREHGYDDDGEIDGHGLLLCARTVQRGGGKASVKVLRWWAHWGQALMMYMGVEYRRS